MQIIKPYAKIINLPGVSDPFDNGFGLAQGIALLKHCEYAARISHRTEDRISEESYDRFLRFIVLEHGDFSVIEHASVSVEAVVDRGITHEWVRHRLGAYTQESTRFVNYNKKIEPSFIYPFEGFCLRCAEGNKAVPVVPSHLMGETIYHNWRHEIYNEYCALNAQWLWGIFTLEKIYKSLISTGASPQQARSVFPNALASKILVTYNLRQWRLFFLMRTCKEAHPQMREVTIPLLKEFQEKIPIIYEDIIPEAKQSDNLKKMR